VVWATLRTPRYCCVQVAHDAELGPVVDEFSHDVDHEADPL
jgi:hypothetical protein